ncbi:MAG: hypothetical protein ACRDJG_01040 [Actinomycetota bacterium]
MKPQGSLLETRHARRHLVTKGSFYEHLAEHGQDSWAVGRAGGFKASDMLPMLVDDDARRWVVYMVGTQEEGRVVPDIEELARRDPEVYFAVTVLWKIISSWVYDLEEY